MNPISTILLLLIVLTNFYQTICNVDLKTVAHAGMKVAGVGTSLAADLVPGGKIVELGVKYVLLPGGKKITKMAWEKIKKGKKHVSAEDAYDHTDKKHSEENKHGHGKEHKDGKHKKERRKTN